MRYLLLVSVLLMVIPAQATAQFPISPTPTVDPFGAGSSTVWNALTGNATMIGTGILSLAGPQAGALSGQTLQPGIDGYAQFRVVDLGADIVISLGNSQTSCCPAIGGYVAHLAGGEVEIREVSWFLRTRVPVNLGDWVQFVVVSGVLTYEINGKPIYTSQQSISFPLKVFVNNWGFGPTLLRSYVGPTFQ